MTEKPARVLLVDDEPNILDALRRQLRREFDIQTAVGAANGLFMLGQKEPFEVIVSDFLMPGINGAEFLAAARKAAPDTTRMLLTGHTDLADAAVTVNQGQVFRMLLKPVDHDTMTTALRDCVAQHRLVTGERELLERTLKGSVKALTEVLALASPGAFGRAGRMARLAAGVLDIVGAEDRWAVELAVLMSQLGVISLPPAVVTKLDSGAELSAAEQVMVDNVPAVAVQLVSAIPRLEPVAEAIRYGRTSFDGSGAPDGRTGTGIPLGGRLIRLVQDYETALLHGLTSTAALASLSSRTDRYDPELVAALTQVTFCADDEPVIGVMLTDLRPGMVLAAPVTSTSQMRLVGSDQPVTVSLITRLQNFALLEDGVAEPVLVYGDSAVTAVDGSALAATS